MSETAEKEGKPFEASDNAANDETEQTFIDGMEPPRIPAIEKHAKKYVKARDSRQEWLQEERVTKEKLRSVMKEHWDELPKRKNEAGHEVGVYPLPNGLEVTVEPTEEEVKVKKVKKLKTDDSE